MLKKNAAFNIFFKKCYCRSNLCKGIFNKILTIFLTINENRKFELCYGNFAAFFKAPEYTAYCLILLITSDITINPISQLVCSI